MTARRGIFCGLESDRRLYMTAEALERRDRVHMTVEDFRPESSPPKPVCDGDISAVARGLSGDIRLWRLDWASRLLGYLGTDSTEPLDDQAADAIAVAKVLQERGGFISNFERWRP